MEAIVKLNNEYFLIGISDKQWELELAQEKYDEVITDFTITEEQRAYIQEWVTFTYDEEVILWDTSSVDQARQAQEIGEKLTRMTAINRELIEFWAVSELISYAPLDTIREAKIAALQDEFNTLKTEIEAYESTLVDSILNSFFG